jgi:hypothetical protein
MRVELAQPARGVEGRTRLVAQLELSQPAAQPVRVELVDGEGTDAAVDPCRGRSDRLRPPPYRCTEERGGGRTLAHLSRAARGLRAPRGAPTAAGGTDR